MKTLIEPPQESGSQHDAATATSIMSAGLARYSFTAAQYERMGAAGIFPPDARLELIEGEIYQMSPIGSPHAACVDFLAMRFAEVSDKRFIVRVQNPIRLSDLSEPQPDIVLARWREDFYRNAHPTPADVLLVVEVADTTVITERKVKLPLYARAEIPEMWLVNVTDEKIEVYSAHAGANYQSVAEFARGSRAQSPTVGALSVAVDELFG